MKRPIVVIADDFTGAAELAGISLRYGLKVQVSLSAVVEMNADVLIVCTDSRSMNQTDAVKITADSVKAALRLNPLFIYKKIDSVFRGHVLAELKVQMLHSGFDKALVIAANPSLGRTIYNGEYFIDGKKIDETSFSSDPEYPITNSFILELLGMQEGVVIKKTTDSLPIKGIVIGESNKEKDSIDWAVKAEDDWVLAGAGDFYTALLDKRFKSLALPGAVLLSPHIYVSGTAFKKSEELISKIAVESNCVAYLPDSMLQSGDENDEPWIKNVGRMLIEQKRVVIAMDALSVPSDIAALLLRITMAKAVKKVVERFGVKELFIEGGSTAAAILQELGIVNMLPVNELQRGVVRMRTNDFYVSVKPGSYELPVQIRELYL